MSKSLLSSKYLKINGVLEDNPIFNKNEWIFYKE